MFENLKFSKSFNVQGRTSIADLFTQGKRCGIYILHFANGEFYAGQAIDVTRRYAQHCKTYQDIRMISFRRVAQARLNQVERFVIQSLGANNFPLRNVIFTPIPRVDSDFDLVMPTKEQKAWLRNLDDVGDKSVLRIVDEGLRRKYRDRFALFLKEKAANEVINLLQSYVRACIPAIRRGEVSFWAVSCLPKDNVYARINIHWQEVLTIYSYEKRLRLSFHLAYSPFERLSDKRWNRFIEKYPSLEVYDHTYKAGGSDQFNMDISASDFEGFIQDATVLGAVRTFNLRLMRKGPSMWGRNHCLDLADKLV